MLTGSCPNGIRPIRLANKTTARFLHIPVRHPRLDSGARHREVVPPVFWLLTSATRSPGSQTLPGMLSTLLIVNQAGWEAFRLYPRIRGFVTGSWSALPGGRLRIPLSCISGHRRQESAIGPFPECGAVNKTGAVLIPLPALKPAPGIRPFSIQKNDPARCLCHNPTQGGRVAVSRPPGEWHRIRQAVRDSGSGSRSESWNQQIVFGLRVSGFDRSLPSTHTKQDTLSRLDILSIPGWKKISRWLKKIDG